MNGRVVVFLTAGVMAVLLVLAPGQTLAFQMIEQLELEAADGEIEVVLVDEARGMLYLATSGNEESARLIRVEQTDLIRSGQLEPGLVDFGSGVISADGAYAFLGLRGTPGRILRVDLEDFSLAGELTLEPGEWLNKTTLPRANGDTVYFGISGHNILRVDTGSFSVTGNLELEPIEVLTGQAVISPNGRHAYWTTNFLGIGGVTSRIVKIDLETFERVDALPIWHYWLTKAFIDPSGESLWLLATYPYLVQIDLASFKVVDGLELPDEAAWFNGAVMGVSGNRAILSWDEQPPFLVRVDLDGMQLMDSTYLDDDGLGVGSLTVGAASSSGHSVYFFSDSEPARLVEIDVEKPYLRFSPAELDFGGSLVGFAAPPLVSRIENIGSAQADLTELFSPLPNFRVAEHDCPDILQAGQGCDLTLLFEPVAIGPHETEFSDSIVETPTAPLTVRGMGQESVAMRLSGQGEPPPWFSGDMQHVGKPLLDPSRGFLRFAFREEISDSVGVASFRSDSLAWWYVTEIERELSHPVDSAISHDSDAVYLAIEEIGGALAKVDFSEFVSDSLEPTGNADPVRWVQTSTVEDRLWFATGSHESRLFEVDGESFSITREMQVASDGGVDSGAIDEAGQRAVLALDSDPIRIVEVDLEDFSISRTLTLPTVQDRLWTSLIEPDASLAYFINSEVLVAVDLDDLSLYDWVNLHEAAGNLSGAALDSDNARAYLAGAGALGGTVSRIDLDTMEVDSLLLLGADYVELGGIALPETGQHALLSSLIDEATRFAALRVELAAPELRMEPAAFDFGESEQFGPSLETEAWLHNDGDQSASLLDFYFPAPGFRLLDSECPDGLLPDQACRLVIGFDPLLAGSHSATLNINSAEGVPSRLDLTAVVTPPPFRDRFETLPEPR